MADVHVVAAGPNAFVQSTNSPGLLTAEDIEQRCPEEAAAASRCEGVGLALARWAEGPVC
ncbi:MAG TPA: hypothetical protein DCQ64_25625 [Candidatus Rokubacteria bacterium]|nr:hypothetical protein [Candidatus Rokubacteria bacterium]